MRIFARRAGEKLIFKDQGHQNLKKNRAWDLLEIVHDSKSHVEGFWINLGYKCGSILDINASLRNIIFEGFRGKTRIERLWPG